MKKKKLAICSDGTPAGNGYSYNVPIGNPIIELSFDNSDKYYHSEISNVLKIWLELEYESIAQRNLGIPNYFEWTVWEINKLPSEKILFSFWNSSPGANITKLLQVTSPVIQSLLLHLRHQNDFQRAKPIIPFAHWLREERLLLQPGIDALNDIESNLPLSTIR